MLFSQMYLPTLKEKPAEAEVISHQLMVRAGMIRKLSSGVYSYLPLGVRSLRKMEAIIREEMDRAGAQEVILPALQPAELWQESGRWDKYGKELFRLKDRHDRDYCLGPTHEEVITDLVRNEIRSYRQLPINLYQIQTKFRDEIRPRFGLMRGREFGMKDGYSFDRDEAGAENSYRRMFEAYNRIFARCGLKFKSVEADSGTIGGSFSHEFMVLADTGEDAILACSLCAYGANVERAVSRLPEPENPEEALRPVRKVDTPAQKTVEEVTRFLGIPASRLVKTLIYQTPQGPVGVLVRGDQEVNETKVRRVLDADEISLAEETLRGMKNFVMGANEEDRHFVDLNWERDLPVSRWADVREVKAGEGCPRCRSPLDAYRGIEVGHVFKLGDKYSRALKATFLDAQGQEQTLIMGCYGIGVGRTVAAAIEQNHDGDGIIWPVALAPFQVIITPTEVTAGSETFETARSLYDQYRAAGLEVLLDDRDERPGIKFKDADLIGIPLRITVGPKGLKENVVEFRPRATKTVQRVAVPQSLEAVREFINQALADS
jgi:prolyl-tRNA synthetase